MLNKFKNKILNRLARISAQRKVKDTFIKNNKLYWGSKEMKNLDINNKKIVLVEISEKNPFELESNMRVAKTIEYLQGMSIVALLKASSKYREPYYGLVESYLISKVILSSTIFNSTYNFFGSFITACKIFTKVQTLEDIESIEYKEILIGDLIYDTYIRMIDGKYSPQKDFKLFKFIVTAINNYKAATKVFDNNNVGYLVVADKCYLNHGILYRVAVQRGINTFLPVKELKLIHQDNIYTHIYHPELSLKEMSDKLSEVDFDREVETYFKARFSGNIDQIDVLSSYKNKKMYSKKSIEELLNLDPEKKHIIIMPHAFSDFPHISNGLYSDYYVWLVNLLKVIRDVDNVNWLIKPHPTSYVFNEIGAVENLLDELGVYNVKVVPSDMNTASIKDFADVILTVRGTAGLEFSTFGIPVVTAGEGCYSGYGIDISSSSISEYESRVKNLDKISRLDEMSINRAKMVFYYLFIKKNGRLDYLWNDFGNNMDDFDKVLLNIVNNNKTESFMNNTLFKDTSDLLERLN